MSQFSEMLKQLTDNCGTTIYKIAKDANLDRTTIQRSITGERLPNIAFVEKLCEYLSVSPLERIELMELYSISKLGEKIYSQRKYVLFLLNQIADLHITKNINTNNKKALNNGIDFLQELKVFSGQYSVNKIILDLLENETYNSESSCVSLNVPFDYSFLFNSLYQLYWENNGKLLINHLVKFNKNSENQQNPNNNLEILSKILPLAFCIGNGYRPFYYYSVTEVPDNITLTMPYYILTNKLLITISVDFKAAILYNNREIIDIHKDSFQKCLVQAKPLIKKLSDCNDLISNFLVAYQNFGEVTNVIEPQPCLAKYYTQQFINEHFRPDIQHRGIMIQILYDFYGNIDKYAPSINSFFSIDGLKYFIETGIMADLPDKYATPFSIAERKLFLNLLTNDIKNKNILFRIVNSTKLNISPFTSIQSYKNNGILFCAVDNDNMVSCVIDEYSICDAFNDFFENLPDSDAVYNKEDTIKIMENLIKQIED